MKKMVLGALAGALMFGAGVAHAEKLVIAGRDGAYGEALAVAVDKYKAAHPDVDIERLELTGGGLLEKVVIAMREKSSAYDVIMMDDPWAVEFMSKGWLANLDDLGGGVSDDFVAPARAVSRYPVGTGPYFAVPFVGNVELFAYRKDLFDKYGLGTPATWTDVLAAAKTIGDKEEGVSGVVFRGKKANPIVTGFLPILWSHGARVVDDKGHAALDSKAAVDALKTFLELAKYAPKGVETYNATEVRDAMMQGTTAMTIELWPAWAPSLDDPSKSKVPGQMEIIAAPGQVTGPAPMLGSWLVAIPAESKHKTAARSFIDFLTSPEMQKELALEVGTPPTRASVYADNDVVSKYRWYPNQVKALMASKPRPRITQWAKVETILGDYLQLALIGKMSADEAMAAANDKVEQALTRY